MRTDGLAGSTRSADVMRRASRRPVAVPQGRAPADRAIGWHEVRVRAETALAPPHPHLVMRPRREPVPTVPAIERMARTRHRERDRRRQRRGGRLRVRLSARAHEPDPGPDDRGARSPIRCGCAHHPTPSCMHASMQEATAGRTAGPRTGTLRSSAWLDLGDARVVLTVPETHGRFYALSLVDLWTNVFASVGARTTGTGRGIYVIVGPGANALGAPAGRAADPGADADGPDRGLDAGRRRRRMHRSARRAGRATG